MLRIAPTPPDTGRCNQDLPRNFSWLRVNSIAGCACPSSEMELRALVGMGIKYLVTLSTDSPPPQCIHAVRGLNWVTIPIKNFKGASMTNIKEFKKICDKARSESTSICVHCRMGRGRTGTMLAAYLMFYESLSRKEAVATVRGLRPGSIETRDQEKCLEVLEEYIETMCVEKF